MALLKGFRKDLCAWPLKENSSCSFPVTFILFGIFRKTMQTDAAVPKKWSVDLVDFFLKDTRIVHDRFLSDFMTCIS